MYGYGGIWIIVGLIALALFLALIVALIIIAVSSSRRGGTHATQPGPGREAGPEDPLEILRRRYARGEITREEYQSMHEDLRH